jgi:hypothetical protein
MGVVSEVVRSHPAEPVALEVIRSGPRISNRGDEGLVRLRDGRRILLLLLLRPSRILLFVGGDLG